MDLRGYARSRRRTRTYEWPSLSKKFEIRADEQVAGGVDIGRVARLVAPSDGGGVNCEVLSVHSICCSTERSVSESEDPSALKNLIAT